ncbi:MAG TPA: hypothetical protein VHD87_05185 [Acidimicrobiales bacterium]|nr:hypothetical protein [Acidimicrobiales bacterium]
MKKRTLVNLAGFAFGVGGLLFAATPAFANTSNVSTMSATSTVNPDGTDTVTVSGTWTWPAGQQCVGRYGTGWAIGWWGIGATTTPAHNFTLIDATQITSPDQGENGNPPSTGSITATGSIPFPKSGDFANQHFYVGQYYDGSEIFTQDFCNQAQPPDGTSTAAFSGTFSASATYPSADDVPDEICVNTYDEHGKLGQATTGSGGSLSNDFNPSKDGDNSIQSKQFTESTNCASTSAGAPLPIGAVGGVGLAGLAGVGLVFLQRRSRAAS